MKRIYLKLISFFVLCSLITPICLCGCDMGDIYLGTEIDIMYSGETRFINVRTGSNKFADNLLYASENPEVATVTDFGVIWAAEPGKTTIYVQSKDDESKRLQFDLEVRYRTESESTPTSVATNSGYLGKGYDFWIANNYSERSDDLLSVVGVVAGKKAGDYAFTEMYDLGSVSNAVAYSFSDWGNEDVYLSFAGVDPSTVSRALAEHFGISASLINKKCAEDIAQTLNKEISEVARVMQYRVHLSELSDEYEYRVIVLVDCSAVKTVNYYSRGLVDGIASLWGDITSSDMGSFLTSYTYSEVSYELVDFSSVGIVIEQRKR